MPSCARCVGMPISSKKRFMVRMPSRAVRSGMMEIHLHAKYAVRQLSKARKIVLHFVQRPGREQHGQTGTVCNLIAERGQLMLELMHREQSACGRSRCIVM